MYRSPPPPPVKSSPPPVTSQPSPQATPAANGKYAPGQIIWSDEFSGYPGATSGIDPGKWSFQNGDGSYWGVKGAGCPHNTYLAMKLQDDELSLLSWQHPSVVCSWRHWQTVSQPQPCIWAAARV